MARRSEAGPIDRDELLGEAIEAYLALAEAGDAPPPDASAFAAGYPELGEDLRAALDGLALVRGLVGDGTGSGPGSSAPLEAGRHIAGYRIVRELGRGGMGVVYEAVHLDLDRPVALKVLGQHAAPDSTGRRRFLNEARTAAGLHHTHIVPVFDVGQVGGMCYYAMQRIEGSGLDRVLKALRRERSTGAGSTAGSSGRRRHAETSANGKGASPSPAGLATTGQFEVAARAQVRTDGLSRAAAAAAAVTAETSRRGGVGDSTASWVAGAAGTGFEPRREPMTLEHDQDDDDGIAPAYAPPRGAAYYRWVAEVGRQAAEALAHAHQRGVIHRDVKPSNLLIDGRGSIWVADFGLARRLADPSLTQHDSLLGTPRYMSPEQAKTGPIDGRTDVYSLGATMYELLTLRPPFDGRSAAELIDLIKLREPVATRKYDSRLPRDLETIVLKCLSKRAEDRYASAQDLADDLARFLAMEPVRARRIGPLGRAWRFARRHPGMSLVSIAALSTVLTTATFAYMRVAAARDRLHDALDEKNQALSKTQEALDKTAEANEATRAAMRTQLWQSATVARMSQMPNKRATGLNLVRRATALDPDEELTSKLRDEATALLAERDVERRPDLATGSARSLEYVADGTRLAVLGEDGRELRFWDAGKRTLLKTQPLDELDAGGRYAVEPSFFTSPRLAEVGPWLAVALPSGEGFCFFDVETGEAVKTVDTPGSQILSLYSAPENARLITVDRKLATQAAEAGAKSAAEIVDRRPITVRLWDLAQLDEPIATPVRWEPTNGRPVIPLAAVSADGRRFATTRVGGTTIRMFATEDGTELGSIETRVEMTAIALGPDGVLAVAGGGSIRLWDIESGTQTSTIDPRQSFIRLLRFSPSGPSGSLLAAAGAGPEVELWETASHRLVAVLPTQDQILDVAFAPRGRSLTAAGHGVASSVWGVIEPLVRLRLSGRDSFPTSLAFRDDGLLAMGARDGGVQFLQPKRKFGTDHFGRGRGVAVGSRHEGRGQQGAASIGVEEGGPPPPPGGPGPSGPGMLGWGPGHDPRSRKLTGIPGVEKRDEPGSAPDCPVAVAFDKEGQLIILTPDELECFQRPPRGFDKTTVKLPASPSIWTPVTPCVGIQDGAALIFARQDQLMLWRSSDPKTVTPIAPPPLPVFIENASTNGDVVPEALRKSYRVLAASPTGDRVYLIDTWGGFQVWRIENNAASVVEWSDVPKTGATTLALAHDGKLLALADRTGSVRLIDTARGAVLSRFSTPDKEESDSASSSIAFAPDGRELAVGTQAGVVRLWSIEDPKSPRTRIRLPGHRGYIVALVYDGVGGRLASAGLDKLIDVWDLGRLREELDALSLAW